MLERVTAEGRGCRGGVQVYRAEKLGCGRQRGCKMGLRQARCVRSCTQPCMATSGTLAALGMGTLSLCPMGGNAQSSPLPIPHLMRPSMAHSPLTSPCLLQGGMELSPCQLCIPLLSPAEEDVPSCRLLDTDYSNHILLLSDREYQGRIISVLFLYSKSWRKQELGRQGVYGADPSVSGMGTAGKFSPGHSGDVWTVCSGTNTAPRCASLCLEGGGFGQFWPGCSHHSVPCR